MKKFLVILLLTILCWSCTSMMIDDSANSSLVFQNNHIVHPDKTFWSFMRMRYFGDDEWADHEKDAKDIKVIKTSTSELSGNHNIPQITWVGHSTFLIQYKGKSILTDPIFSDRASPVSFAGPKRLVELPIELNQLPDIDLVVISHNHYDHLDEASIVQLGNNPLYAVPDSLRGWFTSAKIDSKKVIEFKWWQSFTYDSGIQITATPSQHWSSRSLFDRNKTHWASWLITIDDFTFWFAGDTGYNPYDFKEIGEKFPAIDLALIPIGAYAPRHFMKAYHVNEAEALQIHHDVGAKTSIGMHWGTFPLTAEPPAAPPKMLESLLSQSDEPADFKALTIGETIKLESFSPSSTARPSTIGN